MIAVSSRQKTEKLLFKYGDQRYRLRELIQERRHAMSAYSASILIFICKSGSKPNSQQERWILRISKIDAEWEEIMETRGLIKSAMNYLTYQERKIIKLKYWEGYGRYDICEAMGLPLRTYHRRLNAAIDKVARNLT